MFFYAISSVMNENLVLNQEIIHFQVLIWMMTKRMSKGLSLEPKLWSLEFIWRSWRSYGLDPGRVLKPWPRRIEKSKEKEKTRGTTWHLPVSLSCAWVCGQRRKPRLDGHTALHLVVPLSREREYDVEELLGINTACNLPVPTSHGLVWGLKGRFVLRARLNTWPCAPTVPAIIFSMRSFSRDLLEDLKSFSYLLTLKISPNPTITKKAIENVMP